MIRCAGFDFDGTLVDSNEIKQRAFFEIAEPYDPDGRVVRSIFESPAPGDRYAITQAMAQHFVEDADAARALAVELAADYSERCEREVTVCKEIPGATRALEVLSTRGLPLYINTATPGDAIMSILRARKLDHFFAGVFGSESSKLENLRAIAAHARCQPNEVLFVGDGEDDRHGASAFGCSFIGVAVDGRGRFEVTPQTQIPDLRSLPDLVDDSNRIRA